MQKIYISSGFGLKIISKLFSKNIVEKYEKIKKIIKNIGTKYLIILTIINVILILFYIIVLIYANVELSNNLDEFIQVHLNMKKSIIMLLLVKSKFIGNKNKMEKYKYFNAWSKVESKKRNKMMSEIYKLDFENNVGNITGVEKVTINNSISSEKNIITISTEEVEEKIMNLPNLSEKLINKKIVGGELDSKESLERELYLKRVDEEFKNIIIYLKISSCYITKKNYLKIVNILLENLSKIGVDSEYFKELEEILRKRKKDFISTNYKINLEDNPIFNKHFYLYVELSNIIEKKNAKINLSIWYDFIQLFETSEKFKHPELTKLNEKLINNLKQEYQIISDEILYKEYYPKRKKSRKNSENSSDKIIKYFKDSDYQKILDKKLLEFLNDLKKEQIELLTNKIIEGVNDFSKLIDYIVDLIFNFFENLIFKILDTGYISNTYSDNPKIIKKVIKKDNELVMELYKEQQSSDLSVLLNNIKNIESIKISEDKLSK